MAKNYYAEHFEDSDEGNQYESKTPLERFYLCSQSYNVTERKAIVRILLEIFQTVPANILVKELPGLMQGLSNLAYESNLTCHVLEQVPQIASKALECSDKCPELKDIVTEYLLPLVVRDLGASDTTIDKRAQNTLVELIKQGFINKAQVEIKVCPSILALSNSNILDVITGSIVLMSRLAPLLGRDVAERVFLKRFTELCEHYEFIVRKFCTSHFGDFAAVIGRDTFETVLLPRYLRLCSDETWSVRKSSAAVVMFVSCACTPETRKWSLAPVFVPLLQDENKWVRRAAFNSLGPFISTFASPNVISMAYNSDGELVLVNNDGSEFLMDLAAEKQPSMYEKLTKDMIDPYDIFSYSNGNNAQLPDIDNVPKPQQKAEESADMEAAEATTDEVEEQPPPPPRRELDTSTNTCLIKTDDIKEMVETMKNLVLRGLDNEFNLSNGNVIQNECKSCDSLDNALTKPNDGAVVKKEAEEISNNETDVNRNIDKTKIKNGNYEIPEIKAEDIDNENGANQVNNSDTETEDDLHLFNSYNYWYIEPELPLDPDLIKGLPRNENGAGDISSNLEDLYSNINLSDNFIDDCLEKTRLLDNWADDTFSVNNSTTDDVSEVETKPQQDIVPQLLIDHYICMTDENLSRNLDCEMSYSCAYSLPAVAITLGEKNWLLLKKTVETLAVDMQYKVRKTVASSLHELAQILGPEVATETLAPLFDGFLKDLDEVKIGVLKHLAQFLKLINVNKRNLYLPRLEEFLKTDNESNWRFKEELGNQLILALPLFRATDSAKFIGKIAQELLVDKVYAVREVAILLVIAIMKHISHESGLLPHLLIKLAEKLAHSKIWKRRQTYALLCLEMVAKNAVGNELFASEVLPHLLDLSWDPVANVRLVVAKILSQHIVKDAYFYNKKSEHFDGLEIVLKRLRADKDKDVREAAGEHHHTTTTTPGDHFSHVGF